MHRTLAVLAVTLAVLVVGCTGGSGTPAATATPEPTATPDPVDLEVATVVKHIAEVRLRASELILAATQVRNGNLDAGVGFETTCALVPEDGWEFQDKLTALSRGGSIWPPEYKELNDAVAGTCYALQQEKQKGPLDSGDYRVFAALILGSTVGPAKVRTEHDELYDIEGKVRQRAEARARSSSGSSR